MKLIYVAGPFSGETAWDVEKNVRNAEQAGWRIAEQGGMPVIPHANSRFFFGQFTAQFWYDGTMELMRRCDAIFVLPGFQNSKGTLAEIEEAEAKKIPVFYHYRDLFDWMSGYNY